MRSRSGTSHNENPVSAILFDDAKATVRAFVHGAGIDVAAAAAFGAGVPGSAVAAAILAFDRNGWPRLVLLDEVDLHGARSAYDNQHNTIYLSREFVAASYGAPSLVNAVLIEEIGHAIDARVNRIDAPGDEGAIFADFVLGHPPGAAELAALRAENDHGTITAHGRSVGVEFAAPVVGSITLDGNLSDWAAGDQIDKTASVTGYDIYGKASGGSYVFALKAPVAIGVDTTAWLNTDQNAATGYQIWDFAGGTEYNINFDAAGVPHLYKGDAGQTLVSSATVSFGYSADRKIVEFGVPTAAIGSPKAINTLWDVNDDIFLPTDYSSTQYEVLGSTVTLPPRTDFSRKVGIVYSDSSANQYWDKMAYSQLFMDAQNQATMAGVRYDVLTESDLTNLAKLVNYDALVFAGFANVKVADAGKIESNLKIASQQYHIGLVAAGEFMVYDANGAPLAGDPYARMKTLLDLQLVGSGFPANITVNAGDITHPMMQDYASKELIHSYTGDGWLAFAPVTIAGTSVLATQTVGGQTYDAVVATNTGGRNVHFSTEAVMADNNLLWQAIDYAVNGSSVSAGLQLSRQISVVASRTDLDQAMETLDVSPPGGGPGIYDKLLPILQQWKTAYNFVGSYYIDIGNNPGQDQATNWAKSGAYYKQLIAMGNELGSHSVTHPDNTNVLTASQFQSEFQGSKQIIEQQMSQILGKPFTVDGAAVPGAPESLATALSIIQYYNYLSGGFSGVGAGYPGAIGYLNPTMASQNKVYIAPNVEFDFSLVEFKGMTPAQASAEWAKEVASLKSHAEVPVLVWPWHDYGAAAWATNPPAGSPYTTAMFTSFIAQAYSSGAEFVTLDDLAERVSSFAKSAVTTSVSGNIVTATVTSPDADKFALDLDNVGAQTIASVNNWYAYDQDSVFLPRNAGSYTIRLGTAADDVTHIIKLPMRAELLSVSGNGSNLSFSLIGEGDVVIDLKNFSGQSLAIAGATMKSLSGEILTLNVGAFGQHDVTVTLSAAGTNRAPTITSNGGGDAATISVPENGTAVTTVTASDADAGQTVTYSIVGGADQARFQVTGGVLRFVTAPNFEARGDADGNNSYIVQVRAADNGSPILSDVQTITVSVTDLNDNAPVITTAASVAVAENATFVAALTATDVDTVGTNPAVFSITGGADAARFSIVGGSLRFTAAPDFESPVDADRNNSYVVQVTASDGVNPTNRTIAAIVTDVAEGTNRAPVITSNGGGPTASISVAENSTAVSTIAATDPDPGQTPAYSISGGADAARFAINAGNGALTFRVAPDYEAPTDVGANNVYDIIVAARDSAGALDTQAIGVTVTNIAGVTLTGNNSANTLTGTSEQDTLSGLGGNDTLNGGGGNDTLNGGSGNDTLNGGTGNDTLIGGGGNDVLIYDAADGSIQGGTGTDTLRITGSGATLNLTLIPDTRITNVEVIDLTGTGNNSVALALADVLAISSTTDTLRVDGNAGDLLTAANAGSWARGADQNIGANTYHAYAQASALLLVDTDLSTNLV